MDCARLPYTAANAPATWDEWLWPDWVPQETRDEIREFWSWGGRKPIDYIESAEERDSPPLGARLRQRQLFSKGTEISGRWVHCWNNIGRLVGDDGVPRLAAIAKARQ